MSIVLAVLVVVALSSCGAKPVAAKPAPAYTTLHQTPPSTAAPSPPAQAPPPPPPRAAPPPTAQATTTTTTSSTSSTTYSAAQIDQGQSPTPSDLQHQQQQIASAPAYQHLPYNGTGGGRGSDIQADIVSYDSASKPVVDIISAGTLPQAQAAWAGFLAMYGDPGTYYDTDFIPNVGNG